MVRRLKINRYRKLSNVSIDFEPGVNAISGPNGTCKSTLLHLISNSFQAVTSSDSRLISSDCLKLIRDLNAQVNTKVEKLARGDREYNDPAPGYKGGTLFEVEYENGSKLEFRRHVAKSVGRYAVKPYYKKGESEKLPSLPVIYLSLSRLIPWGEYQDEEAVKYPNATIPADFANSLSVLYKKMTQITTHSLSPQIVGTVKKRQEFLTDNAGVDSNTISSGEENVLIILTALQSLAYYFASLKADAQDEKVCSILLIDEMDATLHPSLQHRLLDELIRYAFDYHIQVVFTTHSITLLNRMFERKLNVVYLHNQIEYAVPLPDPDPMKIEMFLKNETRENLVERKVIPVFTEDDQARFFTSLLLDYLSERSSGFCSLRESIHMIDANIGAELLERLFTDEVVRQSSMAAFCILDGDKRANLNNNIITLPGAISFGPERNHTGLSPEWVAFNYADWLAADCLNEFWLYPAILAEGYSIEFYLNKIKPQIDKLRASNVSEREKVKKLFEQYKSFFCYILKAWIHNEENYEQVQEFARNIGIMYRKTAIYHGLFISKDIDLSI